MSLVTDELLIRSVWCSVKQFYALAACMIAALVPLGTRLEVSDVL